MIRDLHLEIIELEKVAIALPELLDLTKVKAIRDNADALRHNAQLGPKLQNRAAEIRLRAERRAGELLTTLSLHGGSRKSSSQIERLSLSSLGIDHNQSFRWQCLAAIPVRHFEEYIATSIEQGKPISSNRLLNFEGQRNSKRFSKLENWGRVDGKQSVGAVVLAKRKAIVRATSKGGQRAPNTATALQEMMDQRAFLATILVPICRTDSGMLNASERRVILRLLSDVEESMLQLKQELRTSDSR
jgi:hypothetical protein